MKRFFDVRPTVAAVVGVTLVTVGLMSLSSPAVAAASDITVLTYNVYGARQDGNVPAGLKWTNRKSAVINKINSHAPDIFGVQEASRSSAVNSATDLVSSFASVNGAYRVYPTTNPEPGGPKMIFYRKSRFTPVIENGVTLQGAPAIFAGDASCGTPRYMSWIMLRDSVSNKRVFVANAHLPVGTTCNAAKLAAAKKVRYVISNKNPNKYPTILLGDLNNKPAPCFKNPNDPNAAPLKWLLSKSDIGLLLKPDAALTNCNSTNNENWPIANGQGVRIDHILTSGKFNILSRSVDRGAVSIGGSQGWFAHPSDHYPVKVKLGFK